MITTSKHQRVFGYPLTGALFLFTLAMIGQSCQKMDRSVPFSASDPAYVEWKLTDSTTVRAVNLVSDTSEYNPQFIDPLLVNAWGIAISDENGFWVNAAETHVSNIYNHEGGMLAPAVFIPGDSGTAGNPTGIVYNKTSDFVIPDSANQVSEFIFATENGTIAAWAPAETSAITVADRSAQEAVYKGLEIASVGGVNYLYATDFKNAKIDVFNATFQYDSTMNFIDPDMPSGFAPFNIKLINGQLWVTYAKQLGPENEDDEAGPGNGFVDIYNTDGTFVSRFASQGSLNSPWGIEKLPAGQGYMVGNFGDGKVNVFDNSGNWMVALHDSTGSDLVIEGLWALKFPAKNDTTIRKRLYFTAGPDDEEHGVFGYIIPNY